jgi:hypothetical protein
MCLGLLKNIALRGGPDVRSDERVYHLARLRTMGVDEVETFIRPRIIPVYDFKDQAGLWEEKTQTPFVHLPEETNLSEAVLTSDSAFLVDDGHTLFLRLGKALDPQWLKDVFDVDDIRSMDPRKVLHGVSHWGCYDVMCCDGDVLLWHDALWSHGCSLTLVPVSMLMIVQMALRVPDENDRDSACRRLNNIVDYLRSLTSSYQELHVVTEGGVSEGLFLKQLVEDSTSDQPSLAQFQHHIYHGTGF